MPYPKGCLLQPGKASLSMDVMVQRRPSLRTGYPIRFPERDRIIPSSTLDTIDWKTEGIHHERDIKEMTGYFWKTKDVNAFGAYTPSLGSGSIISPTNPVRPVSSYGVMA